MFRKAYALLPLTLLLITAGYAWLFVVQLRAEELTIARQLESIGHMKAGEVTRWRAHALQEVTALAQRRIVADYLAALQTQPGTPPPAILMQALDGYRLVTNVEDFFLLDTTGQVLARTESASQLDVGRVRALVARAVAESTSTLSDIYVDGPDDVPRIAAAAPLHHPDGTAAGAVVAVIDAATELYPLLKEWPVPSETAECYLVQRSEDTVTFLSPLRHDSHATPGHQIPLSETSVTAVRAGLGASGLMEGVDYRGISVIADAQPIPNSGWYLLAEIDQREAFSLWRRNMVHIVALMTLLLLLPLLSGLLLWKERQHAMAQSLAEAGALAARMNRVYRMLSKTNELIVRANTRGELLNGVTQIAVEQGEFLFAWVGEPDSAGTVHPIARAGEDRGYIDAIRASVDPADPRSTGPTGVVLRTGKTVVTNDYLAAMATTPWHAAAQRTGVGASASLALHYHGAVFATLNLYAAQRNFFGEDEVATLERMASDISYALDNLTSSAEHAKLFADLQRALQAVEASPSILFRWKAEEGCPVEYVSNNIARWGYTSEDFLGGTRRYIDIIHPDDLSRCASGHAQLLAREGQECPITYRIFTANGETRWVEDVTSLEHGEDGEIVRLSGIVTDITDRMEVAVRLAESEQRLRLALNASRQGLYDINLQTREVIVSDEYALMLGHDPATFRETTKAWHGRLHPEDRVATVAAFNAYLAKQDGEFQAVFRQQKHDGDWLWTMAVGKILAYDNTGRPLRMLGTITDITAMKQAEELLRLQSASLEAAANGIVITDVNGAVVWANPAFVQLTGYTLEESRGQNPSSLVRSGKHSRAFYQHMWNTILAGSVWHAEIINRRKDGSLYDEDMTITPIRDGTGAITHFVAIKQDITDRKRVLDALKESENRFRGLIEDLDVGVILHDIHGQILVANRAATELLGVSDQTLTTMAPDDARWKMVREDGSPLPPAEVPSEIAAREGTPVRGAIIGSTNLTSGCRIWLSVSATPRWDSDGVLTGVLVTAVNITAERQAEAASLQSKEKLDRAVAAGHIALWDWDIVHDLCTYSDEWCHQVGCQRSELLNTSEDWWSRIHPDDLPQLRTLCENLDTLPNTALTHEYRILHKDGRYRWILGSVSFTRDAAGHTIQMSGANVDITVRKELEEEFRQAQKMESVGRLAGGVAHDFNNILGVILGYTEMALDELAEDSPLYQDLTQVKHASLRAADLTNQLLAFSRRQVLRPELLDLNVVIKQAEKMLGRMVGEDIQIATHYEERLGKVMADPGQINQVILNLAVNARDAMPQGGTLLIATANETLQHAARLRHAVLEPGAYVLITVSDSGSGMDDHTLSHLFEPFFTTKDQGKGTGLGLATVYGIVEQSGGTITVESSIGHGSSFRIYLPRVDSEVPENDDAVEDAVLGGAESILLVEDEFAIRELTRRALTAIGYTVHCAASGVEALALLEKQAPRIDLLLTDVIMPGMSGAVLAQTLVERFPRLPMLYMSGYTDDAIAHHGVLEQGVVLINKPFKISELAKRLRQLLDSVTETA